MWSLVPWLVSCRARARRAGVVGLVGVASRSRAGGRQARRDGRRAARGSVREPPMGVSEIAWRALQLSATWRAKAPRSSSPTVRGQSALRGIEATRTALRSGAGARGSGALEGVEGCCLRRGKENVGDQRSRRWRGWGPRRRHVAGNNAVARFESLQFGFGMRISGMRSRFRPPIIVEGDGADGRSSAVVTAGGPGPTALRRGQMHERLAARSLPATDRRLAALVVV